MAATTRNFRYILYFVVALYAIFAIFFIAHPNVKVFITQCGLQSISEAISKEMPLIGLPFIADQPQNIRKLADFGAAIDLDYLTVTKDELKSAIFEIVTNNS